MKQCNTSNWPNIILLIVSLSLPLKIFASEDESITDTVIKFSAQHYFLTSFIVLIVVGLVARYISLRRTPDQEGKPKRLGMRAMLRRKKRPVV